jgi:DNA-binding Lrp family transcriptional regulator
MPYDKRHVPAEKTVRQVWQYVTNNPRATMQEIAEHITSAYYIWQPPGYASKSTVSRALDELQRRGVLTRQANIARSVVVIEPFSWFDPS